MKIVLAVIGLTMIFGLLSCDADTEIKYEERTVSYASAVTFSSVVNDNGSITVSMASVTEGAAIYYTTDGSNPNSESTKYTQSLTFTENTTVKAIAVKEGIENSPVSSAYVSITERTVEVQVSDTTAPEAISADSVTATAGNEMVLLSWTNSSDSDFYGTRITFTPAVRGITQPIVVEGEAGATATTTIRGLGNGASYTFSLAALDTSQNASAVVTKSATPVSSTDSTAPADVSSLTATNLDGAVSLSWTDPSDTDLFGIEISWSPDASSRSIAAMDEKTVFVAPGSQYVEIPNLVNGTEYTFTAKAMDTNGNKSTGATRTITPSLIEGSVMTIT
ncbi:MAG: chitobiase/beta-hexosaminidase C-terminal domain-containing protein, partial [Treponema sp.]|nr:chitobiase/beta-hexosaminidase C-terminal domain-containing protein [Treponema sp.]